MTLPPTAGVVAPLSRARCVTPGRSAWAANFYVVGSFVEGWTPTYELYEYHPASDRWRRLAAMPTLRGHWGIESMHWLLDVEFKDDLSRYRTGHGAKNMAIVRRFALGLVRANKAKGSVKTRRKTAGWSPDFLLQILQLK